MIPLKLPSWLWGPLAGALVVAGIYWLGYRTATEKAEAQRTEDSLRTVTAIDALQRDRDSLQAALALADQRYRVDTVQLTRWRTKWDSLIRRDTLHDTVTVERVIQVAEQTLTACTQALTTCEERITLHQRDTQTLQAQRDSLAALLVRAAKPGKVSCGPMVGGMPTFDRRGARPVAGFGCTYSVLRF